MTQARASRLLSAGTSAVLASLVLATPAIAAEGHVAWIQGSFAQALARAAESKKPLLAHVYATWCGP